VPSLVLSPDVVGAIVYAALYVVLVLGHIYRDALLLLAGGSVHILLTLLLVVPLVQPEVVLVMVALGLLHIADGLRLAFGRRRR